MSGLSPAGPAGASAMESARAFRAASEGANAGSSRNIRPYRPSNEVERGRLSRPRGRLPPWWSSEASCGGRSVVSASIAAARYPRRTDNHDGRWVHVDYGKLSPTLAAALADFEA